MHISAIQCNKCKDIVYSRARHDMRFCSCESVAIDGGFDYLKYSGVPNDILVGNIDVTITAAKLYTDWRSGKDKYGLIKPTAKLAIVHAFQPLYSKEENKFIEYTQEEDDKQSDMECGVVNRVSVGSCNNCQQQDSKLVVEVRLKNLSFRLCKKCSELLIEKLFNSWIDLDVSKP